MKISVFVTTILFFYFLSFTNELESVALSSFRGRGITNKECKLLTESFRSKYNETAINKIMPRSTMNSILKKQNFKKLNTVSDVSYALAMGRLLPAQCVILGSFEVVGKTSHCKLKIVHMESGNVIREIIEVKKGAPKKLIPSLVYKVTKTIDRIIVKKENIQEVASVELTENKQPPVNPTSKKLSNSKDKDKNKNKKNKKKSKKPSKTRKEKAQKQNNKEKKLATASKKTNTKSIATPQKTVVKSDKDKLIDIVTAIQENDDEDIWGQLSPPIKETEAKPTTKKHSPKSTNTKTTKKQNNTKNPKSKNKVDKPQKPTTTISNATKTNDSLSIQKKTKKTLAVKAKKDKKELKLKNKNAKKAEKKRLKALAKTKKTEKKKQNAAKNAKKDNKTTPQDTTSNQVDTTKFVIQGTYNDKSTKDTTIYLQNYRSNSAVVPKKPVNTTKNIKPTYNTNSNSTTNIKKTPPKTASTENKKEATPPISKNTKQKDIAPEDFYEQKDQAVSNDIASPPEKTDKASEKFTLQKKKEEKIKKEQQKKKEKKEKAAFHKKRKEEAKIALQKKKEDELLAAKKAKEKEKLLKKEKKSQKKENARKKKKKKTTIVTTSIDVEKKESTKQATKEKTIDKNTADKKNKSENKKSNKKGGVIAGITTGIGVAVAVPVILILNNQKNEETEIDDTFIMTIEW